MTSELVNSATSSKLAEMDWMKNIEICELVAHDHSKAKDVIKAIKKRLGSKKANAQLYAVMLLEMLMNNIGEPVHKQVVETGILPILVKIVKKKSDLPVREKIFLLLDAAQTSVGGANGRFPQYYSSYYELVSAGVKFPQRPPDVPKPNPSSNVNRNNPPYKEPAAPQHDLTVPQEEPPHVSDSSILQKAGTALEVLRDVLNAVNSQNSQAAKDEFTLDLVEQCAFQKQRVMHLAMTSRDEKVVSRAIELNEQLERVLWRHDALVSRSPTLASSNHVDHEQVDEEEEAEQLFRRLRKGKACVRPEDEESRTDRPLGLMGRHIPGEILHRPLIRPPPMESRQEPVTRLPMDPPPQEPARPHPVPELKQENSGVARPAVAIPPPPAKHHERERFFQENKGDGGAAINGHMRNLSLHSRNASSSHSESIDFSD